MSRNVINYCNIVNVCNIVSYNARTRCVNKGTLFPKFEEMWKKMTADDVTGAAAVTLYKLDQMKVQLASGQVGVLHFEGRQLCIYPLHEPSLRG